GLAAGSVVADLGSGTGIFTAGLLESGATVHAVEPNDEMRAAAESALGGQPSFRSVASRAEATTLPDASVHLVTAAQAFHWFDLEAARREMRRVLRPRPAGDTRGGNVALVWNDRDVLSTPFLRGYEELLLTRCSKYRELQGKANATHAFDALFGAGGWSRHVATNAQRLDREGLASRLRSSSYAPPPGDPDHAATFEALGAVFDRHVEADGLVTIPYETVVIVGWPVATIPGQVATAGTSA
ncbi:MAG: hypothetical protein JWP97_3900, partial [Labilithrix sp.]|nr:hypothetical protein [Labilithrix sp.]